jgi:hypothetical protein
MTTLAVRRWAPEDGALTEAALRLRYLPAWHHRIAVSEYEPGTRFRGSARAGKLFILGGRCRASWADHEPCTLERLDFVAFPIGEYRFEVLGAAPCKVAHVWVLPPQFRVPPKEII